jgi:hypothetical protein
MMNETTTALRLERETCSRCGGSGHYSYCQMYGTVCFGCRGKKVVLSKRGQVAANYLRQLRSRRADQVQVGNTIVMSDCTISGAVYDAWVKIERIEADVQEGASLKDGVMTPWRMNVLYFHGRRNNTEFIKMAQPATLVEVLLSKEAQITTLRRAVAYQDTLTKSGKPRKARAS